MNMLKRDKSNELPVGKTSTDEDIAPSSFRSQLEAKLGEGAIGVEVRWDGTIAAMYRDPKKWIRVTESPKHPDGIAYGFTTETVHRIGGDALRAFQPLFDDQRSRFPEEATEEGGVQFDVVEGRLVPTRHPLGRLRRANGGWDWQDDLTLDVAPYSLPDTAYSEQLEIEG